MVFQIYFYIKFIHLSKSLNQADHDEADLSVFSGDRDEKTKNRIDQHATAKEPFGPVFLGKNAAWDLSDAVAVKESAQDQTLLRRRPNEFALFAVL